MAEEFTVERANAYIAANKSKVNPLFRPKKHFTAEIGWINDPNGFVYFRGEYHLFYQFYPYGSFWGPMHWGHAKSSDLVNWEHLPVALAPDKPYDKDGCFSGSAIVKDDKLWLMYTGNVIQDDGSVRQIQNMAVSEDGIHFTKIDENPVATGDCLPAEFISADFRDPKLFERNGRYYAVVAAKHMDNVGTVVLLGSDNLIDWQFESTFLKGLPEQGFMWECPDYFHLDGKDVLVVSPMRFQHTEYDYRNLNSTVAMIGKVDWESKTFQTENIHEVDHGHDFYAPQSLEDEASRRIAITWVHNWGRNFPPHDLGHEWAGSMTLPRRLRVVNHHLVQEILASSLNAFQTLSLNKEISHPGKFELGVTESVQLRLGTDTDFISFGYDQDEGVVYVDRSQLKYQPIGEETWDISRRAVKIKAENLLIIIDRNTIEIFVNDGMETLTSAFYIDQPCQLTRY